MANPQKLTMRLHATLPKEPGTIRNDRTALLIGSCFSTEVGVQLLERGFPVAANPFGTLFNPLGMLELLLGPGPDYFQGLNVQREGRWVNFRLHSKISGASEEDLNYQISKAVAATASLLPHCGLVVLTFGTAWVWNLKGDSRPLGNLHKQPQGLFERRLLEVEEIVAAFEGWHRLFQIQNPTCKVILTVSPVIHGRAELHENNLSKSILLLAAHAIRERWPEVGYFPSYEIMRDELRDYRYYAADMQHPSEAAIGYVAECFLESYANAATRKLAEEAQAKGRMAAHRVGDVPGAIDWAEVWKRNGLAAPVIELISAI